MNKVIQIEGHGDLDLEQLRDILDVDAVDRCDIGKDEEGNVILKFYDKDDNPLPLATKG